MKISCGNIMSQIKVKHFGVILLHYITFCAALYFATSKGHLSSLIYHVWQHGIRFFSPITRAFLLINIAVRKISRSTFFSTFVGH